jgi:hypothetical protein
VHLPRIPGLAFGADLTPSSSLRKRRGDALCRTQLVSVPWSWSWGGHPEASSTGKPSKKPLSWTRSTARSDSNVSEGVGVEYIVRWATYSSVAGVSLTKDDEL